MLTPHDILVDLIIESTSATTTKLSVSPLQQIGAFIQKFNYIYDNKLLKSFYSHKIPDNFHIPDGIIRNASKQISITVECKTGASDEDRFLEQLEFFSENQSFRKIFIKADEQNEILVVCLENIAEQIANTVKKQNLSSNIIVWSVDMETYTSGKFPAQIGTNLDDIYCIKKVCGKHLDASLNEGLDVGIPANPPTNHFLTERSGPMQVLVAEVATRLQSHVIESELDVGFFIAHMEDVYVSDRKLLEATRRAFVMIPKLGTMTENNKTILLNKKLKPEEITRRAEEIRNMDDDEFSKDYNLFKKQTRQMSMQEWMNNE